jgi:ribonuclease P protein component
MTDAPPGGANSAAVRNLADRLPDSGRLSADEALETFLEWLDDSGLSLYPAQEEAILEVMADRHVVLATPTGSGKSLVAMAQHFLALSGGERSFYTSPIKALVSEKFFALCEALGPESVGMMTGDASINRDAAVICCTAEILANMALRQGRHAPVDRVVMDEFHYYGDRDRGMAWQVPLLVLKDTKFLLMSATLGDTTAIVRSLVSNIGGPVSEVRSSDRPVPLDFQYSEIPIHAAIEKLIDVDRAPIYLVNSTQRDAAEQAQNLMSAKLVDKPQRQAIATAIGQFAFDSAYGKVVEKALRHGVGIHHAGLLPKYRRLVERLAQAGLLRVISGTDTLGVGINVPIRSVLLSKLCKFDGEQVRLLSVREFQQVSGRAGRKGFDDHGYVVVQAPEHVIENVRLAAKAAGTGKPGGKKKFVRRKPPQRGFVPWTERTFDRLVAGTAEPLQSVFRLDHGTLMTMLHHDDGPTAGLRALVTLVGQSHERPAIKRRLRSELAALFRSLRGADVVIVQRREDGRGSEVVLAEELQRSFSLHHSLSLYLVEALELLDSQGEERALDVVLLVESILENPRVVLGAQTRREKGLLIAQYKAEGIPYDERMQKLEGVTWPKPKSAWIYETFNLFAQTHPWVGHENIRPKAIAHELLQRFCSFDDYVRDLSVQRAEGVLLRYLSQVYKTLVQNVPDRHKDDGVIEAIGTLRAMLGRVDSSLATEWEQLLAGATGDEAAAAETEGPPRIDLARDMRALKARLRAEVHALSRALARGDWQEAAASVRQDGEHGWTPERFEAAISGFSQRFGRLVFDHRTRLADKLAIHPDGPRRWSVAQVLVDDEGLSDEAIHAEVDLGADAADPSGPLLTMLRLGA